MAKLNKPKEYRILMTGDRDWLDHKLVKAVLRREQMLVHKRGEKLVVIEGMAEGLDFYAWLACGTLGIENKRYKADWHKYGRTAGPIRNQRMLTEGKPHTVFAFHDWLWQSKGTAHMIRIARQAGLQVKLITHEGYKIIQPVAGKKAKATTTPVSRVRPAAKVK